MGAKLSKKCDKPAEDAAPAPEAEAPAADAAAAAPAVS